MATTTPTLKGVRLIIMGGDNFDDIVANVPKFQRGNENSCTRTH